MSSKLPNSELKIAVVIATMNRSATVIECVQSLASQTLSPFLVVVADNVSSDGTPDYLRAIEGLPFELIVHSMPENLGNAGGTEVATTIAFQHGADAIWILDDDSFPRPRALEKLIGDYWDENIVRHPIQLVPNSNLMTWPLLIENGLKEWELISSISQLPASEVIRTKGAWTGALISRKISTIVGPVNGQLFIRGEDEEYPWRIAQHGFSFELIKESILDHLGPTNLIHCQFMGKNLFLEPALSDLKLYYKVRNMVWLKKQQAGGWDALLMACAYLIGITRIDGANRAMLILKAAWDGWRSHLGPARL